MIRVKLNHGNSTNNPDATVTTIQGQTYRALLCCLEGNQRVTVRNLMDDLGIEKVKTFFNRLDNLQRKGFIEYSR